MRWSSEKQINLGRAVARRVLGEAGAPNRRITLSLGIPRRVDQEEWQCPIRIEGLENSPIADSAPGVDSLSALLLGAECIRWHLKQSGRDFSWLGDSELMGTGIPLQVPIGFGKEFEGRIERAIEREARNTRKSRSKILRRWFIEGQAVLASQDIRHATPPRSKSAPAKRLRKRKK